MRKKAAEELKKEQERKAAERRRIIEERCGKPKLIDEANEGNADFRYNHQFLYTANKLPVRLVGVFHHFSFHLTTWFVLLDHTEILKSIAKSYYERINKLEDAKYDLEFLVKRKDLEVRVKPECFARDYRFFF